MAKTASIARGAPRPSSSGPCMRPAHLAAWLILWTAALSSSSGGRGRRSSGGGVIPPAAFAIDVEADDDLNVHFEPVDDEEDEDEPPPKLLFPGDSPIVSFTSQESFDALVLNSTQPWFINFHSTDCDPCHDFALEYTKAASDPEVKQVNVGFGSIELRTYKMRKDDVDAYKFVRKMQDAYQIESVPTTLFFAPGEKDAPYRFTGQKGSKWLIGEALSMAQREEGGGGAVPVTFLTFDRTVVQGGQSGIKTWIVAFTSPECQPCQAFKRSFHAAADRLRAGNAKVGLALADKDLAEELFYRFDIQGYPEMKVFKDGLPTEDYKGVRTEDEIVEIAETEAGKEATELLSQSMFETACHPNLKNVCVITALPHILDTGASGRERYLSILANVATDMRKTPFEFFWFEGGNAQLDLEAQLGLTFGFPAVAAVSTSKKVVSIQRGSFSEKNLKRFLDGLLTGKVASSRMPQGGLTVAQTEPWDGKDGVVPEEDELSDIMGDDWQSEL